jgi:hypothetical protein
MFIIRLFTGSIIGMITGFFFSLLLLFVLFAVVVGALAATGGPSPCTPGGASITVDQANSDAFKSKWDAFSRVLDGGAAASVTLNESEISSRADTWLSDHSVPFSDPRVCIHNGSGEASSTFSFAGLHVKIKLKGTMTLTGAHPQAHIDSMEIGNIPGWASAPVESLVNRALDSALNDVNLDHRYTPTLTPGQAAIGGQP